MKPSGPHSSTMGTGEYSTNPTVVLRLWGHLEISPKPVSDQSRTRMSAPTSPPPKGKPSLFPEMVMCCWKLEKTDFCNVNVAWYTSGERKSPLAIWLRELEKPKVAVSWALTTNNGRSGWPQSGPFLQENGGGRLTP